MQKDDYSPERPMEVDATEAAKQGFHVIWGNDSLLLLDLDDEDALSRYETLFPILHKELKALELERWTSKSGEGTHVLLALDKPMSAIYRVALQAALGSDGKRELLAIVRLGKGVAEPSMLFKPTALVHV